MFAMGITFGIYYVNTFLLVLSFIGTIGFALALVFTSTEHPKQKYAFLSTCGLLSGYLASNLCTRIGLETSDIVFVGIATVSIFTALTISAFFTRNLYAFYAISALLFSIVQIPLCIYYLFTWGANVYFLLLLGSLVISMFTILFDTQHIISSVESGCSDPFLLSFILFEDCYDMFVTIAKVLASKKDKD
ncbi:Bax inhibitor [Entamoeba marina]